MFPSRVSLPRLRVSAQWAILVGVAAALALGSAVGAARDAPARPHARTSAAEFASLAPIPVRTLKLRDGVTDLAADGESAAISWGKMGPRTIGCHVSFWHPRTGKLMRLGPHVRPERGSDCDADVLLPGETWSPLAYANGRVEWADSYISFNSRNSRLSLDLISGTSRHPSVMEYLGHATPCCADPLTKATYLGDLVGRGRLLAFSTWNAKPVPTPTVSPSVTDQAIWRIADGGGTCPVFGGEKLRSSHCVEVAEASGPLVPLDVDAGRIVVLRGANTIELIDQTGRTLHAFTPTAAPLAAVLTEQTLAVLTQGALDIYDPETGALIHSWPLPDVPSGGRCTNLGDVCPQLRLQLVAANRGLALYLLDGKAHLLRLRDGRDITVDRAVAADLTTAGLFYTFRMSGHYHGRVRFIPYANLPLRAG